MTSFSATKQKNEAKHKLDCPTPKTTQRQINTKTGLHDQRTIGGPKFANLPLGKTGRDCYKRWPPINHSLSKVRKTDEEITETAERDHDDVRSTC